MKSLQVSVQPCEHVLPQKAVFATPFTNQQEVEALAHGSLQCSIVNIPLQDRNLPFV